MDDDTVPAWSSSPSRFVGRAEMLHGLVEHAVRGTEPAAVLIGGDAGVGKTRLQTELTGIAAAAGSRVLLGNCLDLGESGAPYLPFSQMLRQLGDEDAGKIRRSWPQLVPLLSPGPAPAVDDPAARLEPATVFEALHALLDHLARDGRLLVVIEDLHWADRSTRLLLTYLFTIRFERPVSLVITYRSDDVSRRHPLRRKLAEWTRLPHVQRITLEPLTEPESADLVRGLAPQLDPDQVARIVRRSGGNPFFAEELVAVACPDCTGLPEELADLLLVRVEGLDDDARAVVRAASVAGRHVTDAMLAEVTALDTARLERALRSAVEQHVLRATRSGRYTFRHALLAEAVADDLLPGERVRLHRRYAQAWQSVHDPGAAAALARHARAAGLPDRALEASIAAGDEAMAAHGPADAAQHYENALTILAETPDLTTPVPAARLAIRAGRALLTAGDPHRTVEVLRSAYDDADGDLRATIAANLLEAELIADSPTLSLDAVDEAIHRAGGREPDVTLATLHAVRARALLCDDRFEDATLAATEAVRLARGLEAHSVEADATTTLARLDDFAGDADASQTTLRRVAGQARRHGDVAAEIRALVQLAIVQARANRPAQAADTLATAVHRAEAQDFATGPFAVDARAFCAYYSVLVGEWERADRLLDVRDRRLPGDAAAALAAIEALLLHHRGEQDAALTRAEALRPYWGGDMFTAIHARTVSLLVHGERGDLPAALATYDAVVDTMGSTWQLKAFDAQIRMCAQLAGLLSGQGDRRAGHADAADRIRLLSDDVQRVVDLRASATSLGAESQAWLAVFRAEVARLDPSRSGEAADQLDRAARTFDGIGLRYDAARTRLRLAELLAATGEREAARRGASAALEQATALGAHAVAAALTRLTGGGRGSRDGSGTLTPREREVLRLVMDGRTNGEIASRLFISAKTASVHVSNILGKLGAATRTEAAAIATREGLV